MQYKILDLSNKKDFSELKNSIKKNHIKSCQLMNDKGNEWHINLINEGEKLINLPENNPIKSKDNKSITMSYWEKWNAPIDTANYISNPHKDKPFIDTILKFLKIDKDKYYQYFYNEMLLISITSQTKLLRSEIPSFDNEKYNDNFGDIIKRISKGWVNNSEIWTFLRPHLLKNLPIGWIKSLKLEKYFGKDIDGKNSSEQGIHNGPDFIFIDKENKKVGIEVINLAKNFLTIDSRIKNKKMYASTAFKTTGYEKLLCGGLQQFMEYIRKEILEIKQSKNYVKCQRQYLVVILDSDEIEVGWHEIAEIIINNNSKIRQIYSKVVLI